MESWLIRRFYKHPGRKKFSCSEPELNTYLSRFAGQHEQSGISRTFLAVDRGTDQLGGYYSLSMSSIPRDNLPGHLQKRFPAFPIPVARLVRLAVDENHQGKGLGGRLFMDALSKCYDLSLTIGMVAIVVDTKHEQAALFYRQYGFESLPEQPLLLWLSVKKVQQLF